MKVMLPPLSICILLEPLARLPMKFRAVTLPVKLPTLPFSVFVILAVLANITLAPLMLPPDIVISPPEPDVDIDPPTVKLLVTLALAPKTTLPLKLAVLPANSKLTVKLLTVKLPLDDIFPVFNVVIFATFAS
jgi:hypothetical protein